MHRLAYLLLLLTALFWGGNVVAGKMAVGHISPMLLTALRCGVAALFLLTIAVPRLIADRAAIRQHLLLLTCLGGAGFAAFSIILYTALNYTSGINVAIEQAGVSMMILLGNFVLFGLRPGTAAIAGFLLSTTGVAITASHGELGRLLDLQINFGDALMLIAVIVYAGYTIGLRYKPDMHWQSLMTVMCALAFLTCIPFVIVEQLSGALILPDATGWAAVLYIALFPSMLAQIFYIKGVVLIGANRAGMFINLVPVFGALLSIIVLGEDFHPYHAVAMALVLGGIWLSEIGGRKAPKLPVEPSGRLSG